MRSIRMMKAMRNWKAVLGVVAVCSATAIGVVGCAGSGSSGDNGGGGDACGGGLFLVNFDVDGPAVTSANLESFPGNAGESVVATDNSGVISVTAQMCPPPLGNSNRVFEVMFAGALNPADEYVVGDPSLTSNTLIYRETSVNPGEQPDEIWYGEGVVTVAAKGPQGVTLNLTGSGDGGTMIMRPLEFLNGQVVPNAAVGRFRLNGSGLIEKVK